MKAMSTSTVTAAPRQRKPRPKPERRIRLAVGLNERGQGGVVAITVGKETHEYIADRLASDWGTAFRLSNIDNLKVYEVNLDGDKRTCDCKGFARWNHCKHSDGLAALVKAGKL
jgi:hypothetical protein